MASSAWSWPQPLMSLPVRALRAGEGWANALSAWLLPVYPEGLHAADRRDLIHVFFGDDTLAEAAYPTRFQGMDVVPSGPQLGLPRPNAPRERRPASGPRSTPSATSST
ncbi:hypothetical protein [Streptomyces aureus]|uniref:hypothetical protein n=1 Tax=Streptomyces aureus TaxID=193461 RepID=UPI00131E63B0|nr:hypothetical protein [Streptomyces aureus]